MFQHAFPRLGTNFTVTSVASPDYNCFAWAAHYNDRWWDPFSPDGVWPEGVRRERTIEAFIDAYGIEGFTPCEDALLEAGFEKIAIYARGGKPTHAARQLPDGRWTSKLGPDIDIEHNSLEALVGPAYGTPVIFVKRPR